MPERTLIPAVEGPTIGKAGWWLMDGQPYIVCGGCGLVAGALRNHSVEPDGTVNASIGCPRDGCTWHVWGRLEDWPYGHKAAGGSVTVPATEPAKGGEHG